MSKEAYSMDFRRFGGCLGLTMTVGLLGACGSSVNEEEILSSEAAQSENDTRTGAAASATANRERIETLRAVHSGRCLDVTEFGVGDGVRIQQWDCANSNNQQWKFVEVARGRYTITALNSGKCLDVTAWSTANDVVIQQYACHGGNNQLWELVLAGDQEYSLVNVHSRKCIGFANSEVANGTPLRQKDCSGAIGQRFRLEGVASPGTEAPPGEPTNLVWRQANLTNYTSYPEPGSEECIKYNGCMWAGQFAALNGKQSEEWVRSNNIVAVHGKDFAMYKLKTLRLRQGSKQIDAKVYDMCADSDCSGCCTRNSSQTGFLIDVEKYTMERFGTGSGIVEWACLDCP